MLAAGTEHLSLKRHLAAAAAAAAVRCDAVLEQCCSDTQYYGVQPGLSWGDMPDEKQRWYTDQGCDAKARCLYGAFAPSNVIVHDRSQPWAHGYFLFSYHISVYMR